MAQVNTWRLKFLKIGAHIRETSRRIWVMKRVRGIIQELFTILPGLPLTTGGIWD
jgi:hypothetical protein